jgi:hypothetical protein
LAQNFQVLLFLLPRGRLRNIKIVGSNPTGCDVLPRSLYIAMLLLRKCKCIVSLNLLYIYLRASYWY